MAQMMRMPEVLAGAEEATVHTWHVAVGATISVGQAIAEIETDKAVVELTAEQEGTVGALLVQEGDSVVVGTPIVVLVAPGEGQAAVDAALAAAGGQPSSAPVPAGDSATAPERVASAMSTAPAEAPKPAEPATSAPMAQVVLPTENPSTGGRLFASPLVRRLAKEHRVELADVHGTGPRGRVTRRDLERHLEEQPLDVAYVASAPSAEIAPVADGAAAPAFADVPLSRMRAAIARRLTESKSTVPHFYLVADCHVDELLQLRASINAATEQKVSVNDLVLKAVAGALTDVPEANAIWNGDSIRRFGTVDIAVAVAVPDGLLTPVLRSVERMSVGEIGRTMTDLAARARVGGLRQHEIEGGSFSVSNLGMYGTSEFSAILNPPQSGILAVGAARAMPIVGSDGDIVVGQMMTVTLSADHRVLDGAVAARWLAAFKRRMENPLTILV